MSMMLKRLALAGSGVRRTAVGLKTIKLPALSVVVAVLAMLVLATFVGLVVSVGSLQFDVVLAGLLLFPPLLFLIRTTVLLPIIFVVVFLIQGTIQYFFAFRLATWMASALCGLFLLRTLIELANFRSLPIAKPKIGFGGGLVILSASLYLLSFFFSLSLGHSTFLQLISVLRFCLPMFGVLFAFYWFRWTDKQVQLLWTLLVLIMIAQLPVVTYQHFFKMSTLGWDGVVGTMGKNLSPILILFTVAGIIYPLSLWNNGLMSMKKLLLICGVGLAVILLGEVKIVFVWLPVGVFWVLRRRILKNVAAFIMFAALMAAFGSVTYGVYKALYWGDKHTKGSTTSGVLDSVGGYAFDPNGVNYESGEISRGASLALWYRDPLPTVQQRVIGYGPGASMTGASTGKGVVAARYRRLQIGATGLATLLWDVGIFGTLAFVSMLVCGGLAGWRYSKANKWPPGHLSIVDTSTAMMILCVSTLVYNQTLIDEPAAQLLCYFCLGCIVQYCRYARTVEPTPPAAPTKPTFGRYHSLAQH